MTNNLPIEKLTTLTGERGDRSKMAILHEDLEPILRANLALKAADVSTTPTAAQHNALLSDLRNVVSVLTQIQKRLQTKKIR